MANRVRIEVLGEVRLLAPNGAPIRLPASRKTKALLAYLALTGRPQFREHLCALLWDGAEDPRGALRWCLSRLRAAVDEPGVRRIQSDRKCVQIADGAFEIDVLEARSALKQPGALPPTETLRRVAGLFRGELLEGLDLLDSFRFHTWCMAQREAARALRLRALAGLVDRAGRPDEALGYAREIVSIDPLDEAAHVRVIRLLMSLQRHHDAMEQADVYRRTLEIELGEVPREVSARLRKLVHDDAPAPARPAPKQPVPEPAFETVPMVGRARELDALSSWLEPRDGRPPMALLCGEPGVGKTRLMHEATAALSPRTNVLRGRAYRAENARPLGPWRDALQEIDGARSVLTSAADSGAEQEQRAQLFDELLALIVAQGSIVDRVLVTLDDIQWLDEASSAFLHFLGRSRLSNVSLLATVRAAEVIDNPALGETLESLRRENALLELKLEPLGRAEIGELCSAVAADIDPEQVFARSEGNPFVATELARALARGETELPSNTQNLLEARLRALSEPARDVLPWAAALGRTFHVDALERVTGLDPIALVDRIGELEQRGVFEPQDDGAYDFAHDLIREAAYRELSAPRRRIVHRRIARSLQSWDNDHFSAAELLRHAELGHEPAIACAASAAAAQEALDVYAWVDVCLLADRGLQHTGALDEQTRVATTLALLNCRIAATSVLERHHPEHVREALAEVIALGGTAKQRAEALFFQAIVHRDDGHRERASDAMVAAANAGRKGDPETAARQLANSARCLLHLERNVNEARPMLSEARAELASMGIEDAELFWAEALLARWDGDLTVAAEQLLRAIEVAKKHENHWRQSSCLTALMMVALEAGDPDRVEQLSLGGMVYGEETGAPLASPFVEAIAALADLQRGRTADRLERAVDVLRARGADAQLSYVLAESARIYLAMGERGRAIDAAEEAVARSQQVRRVVPQADALVTVARVAFEQGDEQRARDALTEAEQLARDPHALTARVRERLQQIAAVVGAN